MKAIVIGQNGQPSAATRTMRAAVLTLALVLIAVGGRAPSVGARADAPSFTIKSLGFLPGGKSSYAAGINDQGQITGYAQTYRPRYARYSTPDEAFLYNHGRLERLGLPPDSQESFGVAINDLGQVAVTVERADQRGHRLAFLARLANRRVVWTRLPEPRSRYPSGSPSGINDSGTLVGQSPAVGSTHAATWRTSKGKYHIDQSWVSLSDMSNLAGIDNQGDMVGTNFGSHGQIRHALLGVGYEKPLDLSCRLHSRVPSGFHCRKWDAGVALAVARQRHDVLTVGERFGSAHSSDNRAVEWALNLAAKSRRPSVQETILPLLTGYSLSTATAVNSGGWVVGEMEKAEGGYASAQRQREAGPMFAESEAFGPAVLWHNGKVYDLNSLIPRRSGWTLEQATDINSRGRIVGDGIYRGRSTAFLLTPS